MERTCEVECRIVYSRIPKYIKKHNLQDISDPANVVSPTGTDISVDVDPGELLDIPWRDGSTSQIRIFQPKSTSAKKPLIVMSHGGGQVNMQRTAC
ncbi:hypothetical protein BKA56DRAFT_599265 [Ilyonectria sp. MPI-CAGE-AT-0026]|nr:hypothetical protein BKA56DRAFT_599265 [Ilyonectria sp. MPI-CAGE-AT-0026]